MYRRINEEKLHLVLKECFLFYSKRITESSNNKRTFPLNYTETTSIYNFSKYLKDKHKEYISLDWIFDYFNYQFTYWDWWKVQKEKNGNDSTIMANWVLGQKALKRFLSKTQKDSYFYHSSFFSKYKIQKQEIINLIELKFLFLDIIEEEEEKILNPLNILEEETKKKYYNTIEGFSSCLNFTSLFKFTSPLCKECSWKIKCKIVLKQNYPKLYQKRLANKISLQ